MLDNAYNVLQIANSAQEPAQTVHNVLEHHSLPNQTHVTLVQVLVSLVLQALHLPVHNVNQEWLYTMGIACLSAPL